MSAPGRISEYGGRAVGTDQAKVISKSRPIKNSSVTTGTSMYSRLTYRQLTTF